MKPQWRNALQIIMILTGPNAWFAGVNLGHPPSKTECIDWFFSHGGPKMVARMLDTLALPAPRPVLALPAPSR